MLNKYEQLLEYVVNGETEKARELFHEIVVSESRDIYRDILAQESVDENVEETVEESPEGDTAAEDLVQEVEADEQTFEAEDEDMGEDDMEAHEGGEEDKEDEAEEMASEPEAEEVEDRVTDLEAALDELKKEFEELMSKEEHEEEAMPGVHGGEDMEDMGAEMPKEAIGEAAEMIAAPKPVLNEPAGTQTKSPTAGKNPMPTGKAKGVDPTAGGEEKGRTAPTAKDMGMKFANEPGKKSLDMVAGKKADNKDHSDNDTSPLPKTK